MAPTIDYESLVSSYIGNLTSVLRGFSADEEYEFLSTWVPSDNPLESVAEIFQSAREAHLPQLTLRVAPQTLRTLDLPQLESLLRAMGQLETQTEESGTVSLNLLLSEDDSLAAVGVCYRKRLAASAASHAHEGILNPESDTVFLEFTLGDLTITAIVDPGTHILQKVRYVGPSTAAERAVLEELCNIIEGSPIQESSDHAAIKLENELRDHAQSHPVKGVIAAENADPIFGLALRVTRGLLKAYRERTSYRATDNQYVRPISAGWRSMPDKDRLTRITSALEEFSGSSLSDRGAGIALVDLDGDRRVVVELPASARGRQAGQQLLVLERHLQTKVEPVLEVHLKARADLNTIRKIKEVAK